AMASDDELPIGRDVGAQRAVGAQVAFRLRVADDERYGVLAVVGRPEHVTPRARGLLPRMRESICARRPYRVVLNFGVRVLNSRSGREVPYVVLTLREVTAGVRRPAGDRLRKRRTRRNSRPPDYAFVLERMGPATGNRIEERGRLVFEPDE